jgi:tight adherence protein B
MTIVAASFVLTLSLILGSYWVFIVRPERQAHDVVWKRLKLPGSGNRVRAQLLKRAQQLSTVPAYDTLLTRGRVVIRPVELLLEQSGTRLPVGSFLMISGLCAVVPTLIFQQALGITPLSLAVGALAAMAPTSVLRVKRTKRLLKFEEQFPEALDLLSRAIRAGHAFQTAMGMVADELPAPVGVEFKKSFDQQNFGLPLKEALDELAFRVPILDVRFFVTAVLIQRETGGNLSEILDNLAHVVRERFKILRQVRVHTAHGRFTGYVLLALPAALGIALNFINPDHMRLLFEERMGHMMIATAIVMQIVGYIWIRKVIKIEV